MSIRDIIGVYVFVNDETTGQILRLRAKEFGNRPQQGAELEYKDGKYWCTTVTTDEDCVGGSCPIK